MPLHTQAHSKKKKKTPTRTLQELKGSNIMSYTKASPSPLIFPLSIFITSLLLCSFLNGTSEFAFTPVGGVSEPIKRFLVEKNGTGNSSLILAAERTHRKDPLEDLRYYTGGWNISDNNYRASVVFTAAPLVVVAAFWFLGFGICMLLVCVCCCCCRRRRYGYSRTAYALSLVLLVVFTIAAILGSAVLYTGQGKFHDNTKSTLDFVVRQAGSTVDNLRNVSNILDVAKHTGVNKIFLPQDVQNKIGNVETKISSSAETLERETEKNKKDIMNILDVETRVLVIVAAVMLVLAALGFLFSILGLQFLVYVLVVIGWILIAVTFLISGAFVVLHNATGDTCVAMNEWVKNPKAHTALDDIIPCVDIDTAKETLSQSKEVTNQLVGVVNRIITSVSNVDMPQGVGYNQSGPLVPNLCNPFNSDRTNRNCTSGEVEFSNAKQVWRNYVCKVSASNVCTTVGRLTPAMYDQMTAVVNVSNGLYRYGPFLGELLDCSFLRDTFTVIHNEHCPDLKLYSKWVYIGLALVSAAVMLSLIFWVLYARERRYRKYTKLVDATSGQESFSGKRQG